MALLQFFVCAAFPYFLPVLALGTGIACLAYAVCETTSGWTWRWTLIYAAVCGALDVGYVTLAGLGQSHANVHLGLQFRPDNIVPALRPYMLLLLAAAGLTFFSKASQAAKMTCAGVALSSALFGFADVFFSPEAQMLQHPTYIIATVTWLPLLIYFWSHLEKISRPGVRSLLLGAIIAVGFWEAIASFRMMLPANEFQRKVANELTHLDLNEHDLVIAPSHFSDDVSSWVPLLTSARVLFTGNGENILSANDTRNIQTYRQAMYLIFTGMDVASVRARTRDDSAEADIRPLLQQTDQTYAGSRLKLDQINLRRMLRDRMTRVFAELENEAPANGTVLNAYKRIVVIDNSTAKTFDFAALSRWLIIEKSYERDGVIVLLSYPRFRPETDLVDTEVSSNRK
jgi:hypothetical protein